MRVRIEGVRKDFGVQPVLHDLSIDIQDHELFFLLGPSGCGKTTLLRLVAGFLTPDSGQILFGDRRMNATPAHQRNTGMVFQNYALWPHLSVEANVAYGLDVRRVPAADKRRRVREALELVRMESYAGRSPNQLSGGQQQRVALARALVVQPDILLLDEPLSNLDAQLRLEMREEIRRLHRQTRITTLYVTHDQEEALSLADRIAVLHQGKLQQLGTPRDIYRAPASHFVAGFIGEANWLEGELSGHQPGHTLLSTLGQRWVAQPARTHIPPGPVRVGFRPETVRAGSAPHNEFRGTVRAAGFLGNREELQIQICGGPCIKAVTAPTGNSAPSGDESTAWHVHPHDLLVYPLAHG